MTGTPRAEWMSFANSGSEAAVGEFLHRPARRTVTVFLRCDVPRTGRHVEDELCRIELTGEKVVLRVSNGFADQYVDRIKAVLHMLLPYLENAPLSGSCAVSLGDEGLHGHVLSFCSTSPDFLLPDPDFIMTRGYAGARRLFAEAPPWEDRLNMLYWRGTDTGVWRYRQMEDAPRVGICRLARENPGLIDAAITRIEPRHDQDRKKQYYASRGYLGALAEQSQILRYRYQIDIDGNSSAWASLFLKLLTGSPVLKVASEFNWRQWYYGELRPWDNFVPVSPDLSDVAEVLGYLQAHPGEAKRIGLNGQKLAQSFTLASEIPKAMKTFTRYMALSRTAGMPRSM
jgi:hypothetical protein